MKYKIGVGITTYNSENYFNSLYKTLPFDKIDELVVVNGGNPYVEKYDKVLNWIQHKKNHFPSVCRNQCIEYLLKTNCDYIFIIEDDMLLKNSKVFEKYIEISENTGLKYLCFASTSYGSGEPFNRTPSLTVEYDKDIKVCLYPNMTNEFTMHHKSCFQELGFYDTQFRHIFDIDFTYKEASLGKWASPFWWFADIFNSDEYVMNNPEASSRLEKDRSNELIGEFNKFEIKNKTKIQMINKATKKDVLTKLKEIYNMNVK